MRETKYFAKDEQDNFVQIKSPYIYMRDEDGRFECIDNWPQLVRVMNAMEASFSSAMRCVLRVNRIVNIVTALSIANIVLFIAIILSGLQLLPL